jgi:hypothetical protein
MMEFCPPCHGDGAKTGLSLALWCLLHLDQVEMASGALTGPSVWADRRGNRIRHHALLALHRGSGLGRPFHHGRRRAACGEWSECEGGFY